MQNSEEDLAPTVTAGYKPPAQKTVEELQQLDANDESLRKWKESLLKTTGTNSGNLIFTNKLLGSG